MFGHLGTLYLLRLLQQTLHSQYLLFPIFYLPYQFLYPLLFSFYLPPLLSSLLTKTKRPTLLLLLLLIQSLSSSELINFSEAENFKSQFEIVGNHRYFWKGGNESVNDHLICMKTDERKRVSEDFYFSEIII